MVLCRDGRIAFVGAAEELERRFGPLPEAERLDGRGGTLVPGFVDPHTHLPWAGDRAEEFAQRLAGKTYLEIAAAGGGILSTVRATRQASEEELVERVRQRLDQMLALGTTTAEAKSGYGLTLDDELKQLRAIRAAAADAPGRSGADPAGGARDPARAPRRRASATSTWSATRSSPRPPRPAWPASATSSASRASSPRRSPGGCWWPAASTACQPRLHADEFVDSGGAELAAELGALSADHLVAASDKGIEALAAAGVTAVLLPGTSFFLMKHSWAPARRLIEAGVPVALATDCNPGSSHTESMPMVFVLAVFELGLSIEEALIAATLNAACCLGPGRPRSAPSRRASGPTWCCSPSRRSSTSPTTSAATRWRRWSREAWRWNRRPVERARRERRGATAQEPVPRQMNPPSTKSASRVRS